MGETSMSSLAITAVVAVLALSYQVGGQNGYYAIVGNSDREASPTIPLEPWPDVLCRHDARAAISVCERAR
jgi:hypothetical protein